MSEILGPKLLDVDKKFRTLLLKKRAQDYLDRKDEIHPEALAFLDAFLSGVNHFIATGPLPVEYTLLGYSPRPFTRLETLSAMGYVAYSFADGIKRDSLYTILESHLTRDDLDLVFPDYTLDNRVTITANNLSTMVPIEPIGTLTGYFRPSDRAARIYERLAEKDKWDMEGLKKIQTDTRLYSGPDVHHRPIPESPSYSGTIHPRECRGATIRPQ